MKKAEHRLNSSVQPTEKPRQSRCGAKVYRCGVVGLIFVLKVISTTAHKEL